MRGKINAARGRFSLQTIEQSHPAVERGIGAGKIALDLGR